MDRRELDRLLRQLNWVLPSMVLLACILMVAGYYWLHLKPAAQSAMEREQRIALGQVRARIEGLVGQVERVLLTTRDWGQAGLFEFDNPSAFNRLLLPILRQRAVTSSVHYARDDGREMLLLKAGDKWKNRITDVAGKGKQQRWVEWERDDAPSSDAYREQDYDPRKRPWFAGAAGVAPGELFWTEPYSFQTTKDAGITVSVRWVDAQGRSHVVAYDIQLTDLSRFTGDVAYGEHGYVALLGEDDKLLGVPRHANFADAAAVKAAVFKTADEVGLRLLATALRTLDKGAAANAILTADGEPWQATLEALNVRNRRFTVAALAPLRDFAAIDTRSVWTLSLLVAGLLVAMSWVGRQFSRRFGVPIAGLFDDLAVSQAHLERELEAKNFLADLACRLQNVHTPQEVGQRALSQLAQRLACRQGLVAVLGAAGTLDVVARYGAPDAASASYAIDDGPLGQCIRDKKPQHLAVPVDPQWRIRSGLGNEAPAEVHLYPVEHGGELVGVLEVGVAEALDEGGRLLLEQSLQILGLRLQSLVASGKRG